MNIVSKPADKKALIIGLDGVSCSLLRECVDRGLMPHLKEIMDAGFSIHRMNASLPEISSVSWTSFSTGVDPGEHGVFGFADITPGSYSVYFSNSRCIRAPAIWEILGETAGDKRSSLYGRYKDTIKKRCRSIVINIPHTYPAYPVNGILISGFVAVDPARAVYPAEVSSFLNSLGYVIDVDLEKARSDKGKFLEDLSRSFEIRRSAIRHFMKRESWDVFIAAVTETDRLNHFFYGAWADEKDLYHSRFVEFYRQIDNFLKEAFDAFRQATGERGFFMVLSDHGFAPLTRQVYVNAALRKEGLLSLDEPGEYYERISQRTKAFCMDPGRIYVNEEGRYPRGSVDAGEKAAVISAVREVLSGLRHGDGSPVMKRIYLSSEIYHGPFSSMGPDLVCLAHDGFALRGSLDRTEVFGEDIFTGVHTYGDAACLLSDSVTIDGELSIDRLAALILEYFTASGERRRV